VLFNRQAVATAAFLLGFTLYETMTCNTVRADASNRALFNARASFSSNLSRFTKWNNVVARADLQSQSPENFCQASVSFALCSITQWRDLITEIRTLSLRSRVARVNEVFNRVPYVPAETNWHDADHWETPLEFLQRGGQCEDYAIAKILALEASGVPEQDLQLVIVRDEYLSLDHAIAVVYVDDEPLVLDNQIKDVVPAAQLNRYVPYYAINRTGWWYFGRTTAN